MLSEDGQLSRKNFLKAIAVLGLTSCAPFYTRSRFIHLLTNNPHPDHYNPIIDALINIILPFDHPKFPDITTLTVRNNINHYFPLTEERYEPFQRAFIIFNDIQLFPKKLPAIIDDEKKQFDAFYSALMSKNKNKNLQEASIDTWILMEACNESARKNIKISLKDFKKKLLKNL